MSKKVTDENKSGAHTPDRRRIPLNKGAMVKHEGSFVQIMDIVDTQTIVAANIETGRRVVANIKDLEPVDTALTAHASRDIDSIDDAAWAEAQKRYDAIKPLLEAESSSRAAVNARAKEIGVHAATLYRWLERYKSMGLLSTLVPFKRGWQYGKNRLDARVEKIIDSGIKSHYLRAERPNAEKTVKYIQGLCEEQNLPPPGGMTIRSRIDQIPEYERLKQRGRVEKAKNKFNATPGKFPGAEFPLAVVQIDHTPLDVIVVDRKYRKPLERPWMTVATDVFSRMIVGYYISFDAPSLTSVALCVAHAMLPKDDWLILHGVEAEWPVWGVPKTIHVDNGSDFRSAGFKDACDLYGINLEFRPIKQPRYGGNVERVQKTILHELHDLPGTTFSSVADREGYDSEKKAALTIDELEKQVLRFITNEYHRRPHREIHMPPLRKWLQGIHGGPFNDGVGLQPLFADRSRVLLDFLPAFHRTVQADGVTIDGLRYYDECLRPWIGAKDLTSGKAREHIFRRDPRMADVVWFLDPELDQYFKVPSVDQSVESFSVWEHKSIKAQVKQSGYDPSDRPTVMRSMATRREEANESTGTSKKTRKEQARRELRAKAINPADPLKSKEETVESPLSEFVDKLKNTESDHVSLKVSDIEDLWDDVE